MASGPELGSLGREDQQPVDFAIREAADGKWQIWSCVRKTGEEGCTRLFYRWEGDSPLTPDWKPLHFRTERYGQNATTHVYASKDPLDFGVNDDSKFVVTLPVAAPPGAWPLRGTRYKMCFTGGMRVSSLNRAARLGLFLATSLIGADAGAVKYNPGHYVALEANAKLDAFPFLDEPAIRGFNIRYTWATLEPEENRYDFSAIRRDLAIAAKHGKQLVAFLTDKTFYPAAPNPLPAYMRQHSMTNANGGVTPKKWEKKLIEREIALTQALAMEFDRHPNFEGIAWQESAPSVPLKDLQTAGYTPELFRDCMIRLLSGSSQSLPHSQVFWYQNFLPGKIEYLRDIVQAVLPYRVVLGGPDILPYRKALQFSYGLYDEFRGRMKLSSSAQADSYRHHKDDTENSKKRVFHEGKKPIHPEGYVTMQQIFEFGRDRLHLNYIFWSYITSRPKQYPGDPPAYVFEDALKVIRQNPRFN